MYIVIAGAGRVGSRLANDLTEERHDVVVIDRDPEALENLGKGFDGIALEGQAFDVDVLEEARTGDADFFCAMTNDDNANLMAAEVAKAVFGVERVLARLLDPAREKSYRALGIPYVSTTKFISAVAFEQIVARDFPVHVGFDEGKVEIVEFTLLPEADGMSVAALEIDGALRVAAIRRGEEVVIPDADTPLTGGDLVVASARRGVRKLIGHLIEASS